MKRKEYHCRTFAIAENLWRWEVRKGRRLLKCGTCYTYADAVGLAALAKAAFCMP